MDINIGFILTLHFWYGIGVGYIVARLWHEAIKKQLKEFFRGDKNGNR
jgi:hypothetical protein